MAKNSSGEKSFDVSIANALFDIMPLRKSWQKITQETNHLDVTSAN